MMDKFTPGPWQIVVDKRPHQLGGFHTERRIFTAWNHPQMKGPIGVVNTSVGAAAEKGGELYHMAAISAEDAALIVVAPDMYAILKEAAELFRFYEVSHRAKSPETPDTIEKAERNKEIAERIEAILKAASDAP